MKWIYGYVEIRLNELIDIEYRESNYFKMKV